MSEVAKIIARTQREAEIDGIVYVVRRATGRDFIEAYGQAALGMVEAASDATKGDARSILEGFEKMEAICRLCMVKPKLGAVSDDATETVAWADLGDHQKRVFDLIVGNTFEAARDFPAVSEAPPG